MRERLWTSAKWVAGVICAALVFGAQTKPEDATSNLAGWAKELFGIAKPPEWLDSPSIDSWVTAVAVIALAGLVIWWFMGWRDKYRKKKGSDIPDAISHEANRKKTSFLRIEGGGTLKDSVIENNTSYADVFIDGATDIENSKISGNRHTPLGKDQKDKK